MATATINITKKNKKDFFNKLFDASKPNLNFFLMLSLSTVIVTLGILIDNSTIVIGGMLIAPILYPILSLAMGMVVTDYRLIRNSIWILIQAIFTIVIISIFIAFIMINRQLNIGIMSIAEHGLIYFIIAFLSGIAAAYASSHPRMSEILPGVAIAVSLIPPLAILGIGVSFFSWVIIIKAANLFLLNLLGITFASLIVFSVMDFHEIKSTIKIKVKIEEKKKESKQKEAQKEEITKDMVKIQKTLKEATKILQEENKKALRNKPARRKRSKKK